MHPPAVPEAATAADRPPLRVAVLLGGWRAPRWVRTILERVHEAPFARLVAVLEGTPPPSPARGLLRRAYATVDDLVYRRRAPVDVLATVDLRPVLAGVPVVAPGSAADLDVILDFGGGPTAARAAYGVWSYDHAGDEDGFWEVLDERPTTPATLRVRDSAGPGRVVYRSFAPTDRLSVARNRQNNMAKSAEFVLRVLRDVHRDGAHALAGDEAPPPAPEPASPARLAGGLARLGARWLRQQWLEWRHAEQWIMGFRLGRGPIRQLVPPDDRFWADPFPVEDEDGWWVFFECYRYAARRGHIELLRIGRDGSVSAPRPVLQSETHLSYPCVFSWRGEHYMLPETSARRTVELYRATRYPDRWEPCATLMSGVRAADSTLAEIDGRFWLFTCMAAEGALAADELHLFHADSPLGPFRPHRQNPVKSDARGARPAGRLFLENGGWIRPGQDCAGRYGRAVVLHKITRLTPDHYDEADLRRLEPDWDPKIVATHTYNRAGDLTMVDALRVRR